MSWEDLAIPTNTATSFSNEYSDFESSGSGDYEVSPFSTTTAGAVSDSVQNEKIHYGYDDDYSEGFNRDVTITATDSNNNQIGNVKIRRTTENSETVTFILRPSLVEKDSSSLVGDSIPGTGSGSNETIVDRDLQLQQKLSESENTPNDSDSPPTLSQDSQEFTSNTKADDGTINEDQASATGSNNNTHLQVSIVSFAPNEEKDSDEELMTKSPQEILYEIATGRWSPKHVVLDEILEGTKKLDSRPCSNANCVREAERQKRRQQSYKFKVTQDSVTAEDNCLFEEDRLPSYHSLLHLWKDRNMQWNKSIFKSGNPVSEQEFINLWRECRRNPEAYGIQVTPPQELPDLKKRRKPLCKQKFVKSQIFQTGSPTQKNCTPEDRKLEKQQCEDMIERYEGLRYLYPHLPPITGIEGRTTSKLRIRLKQAEDWHRLMTRPKNPVKMYNGQVTNDENQSQVEIINSNIPRYAAITESFLHKITAPYQNQDQTFD